ncbi:PHP domain-containing protein [Prochlorococcus sp. MIT 1341]|uniref:PHP domain-containing protein n=1 Tax=Prochlorococcus sp. MIT 1341 TaxID=3096221 RepID=UPI002A75DC85|nr:PHP domain-containing protein [Prochlorococcus sp. MIT 1341]
MKLDSPRTTITSVLSTITPLSCPNLVNFHTHTTCSDGSMHPVDLIKQATSIGLKHISITDHHSIEAYTLIDRWLAETNQQFMDLPTLWTGIEISCLLNKCLIHAIGLGFDRNHKALQPYIYKQAPIGEYLQARKVSESIHDAGGIVLLAHPARYRVGFSTLISAAADIGFDGAEAWYDYDFNPSWQYSTFVCERISTQLNNLGLLSSCGTDSHGKSLLGR